MAWTAIMGQDDVVGSVELWASRGHSLWIIKAEYEDLPALMAQTQKLTLKGQYLMEDFEYDIHVYGREANLGPYEALVSELAG